MEGGAEKSEGWREVQGSLRDRGRHGDSWLAADVAQGLQHFPLMIILILSLYLTLVLNLDCGTSAWTAAGHTTQDTGKKNKAIQNTPRRKVVKFNERD